MARSKGQRHSPKPLPLCACGCGLPVRCRFSTWRRECVPTSFRREGGVRGRRSYAYTRRSLRFEQDLQRLTTDGKRITRERLLETFEAIYDRAYHIGYQACTAKLDRRRGAAA